MRESELREHTACSICKQKICSVGLPLFWTVDIKRYGIKMDVVRRQDGLAALLRNSELASIMGVDEDMTVILEDAKLTLCEECAIKGFNLLCMLDLASDKG